MTIALCACQNNESFFQTDSSPLTVQVKTAHPDTRALIETTTLPADSQVGLSLVDNSDGATTYDGNTYSNIAFTTTDGNSWSSTTFIGLNENLGKAAIYYPYNADVTDITAVPVAAGNTDYMYSGYLTGLSATNPEATFTLDHAMAAIRVSLKKSADYAATVAATEITIKGAAFGTAATLDATTGILSNITGQDETLTQSINLQLSTNNQTADFIVVPDAAATDNTLQFIVTIGGEQFTAKFTPEQPLNQGTISYYTLTLTPTGLTLNASKSTDWNESNTTGELVDPWTDWVIATYNITSTSSSFLLQNTPFTSSSALDNIEDVAYMDGIEIKKKQKYTFSSIGLHEYKFKLKDNTKIPSELFYNCDLLYSIKLPKDVTQIESDAFYDCDKLENVNLPQNLQTIGASAFYSCGALSGSLNIPNSVTEIESEAFKYCTKITSLQLGTGLKTIAYKSFEYCTGLSGTLSIPENVTSIENSAFGECTGIKKLTLNDKLIFLSGFNGCTGLSGTLNIPKSCTSIGGDAFYNCSGLTGTLIIPDACTSIGTSAFAYCEGLTALDLGSGVQTIGETALYYCTALKSIISKPMTAPTIYSDTFRRIKSGGTLTVPTGATGYGTWISSDSYYPGYYNWALEYSDDLLTE